jgi:hypothetical protein
MVDRELPVLGFPALGLVAVVCLLGELCIVVPDTVDRELPVLGFPALGLVAVVCLLGELCIVVPVTDPDDDVVTG